MITVAFIILMLGVFGKMCIWGLKASWSIFKFCMWIVFLPLLLIAMVIGGLVYIALPIVIVVGIISLIIHASEAN